MHCPCVLFHPPFYSYCPHVADPSGATSSPNVSTSLNATPSPIMNPLPLVCHLLLMHHILLVKRILLICHLLPHSSVHQTETHQDLLPAPASSPGRGSGGTLAAAAAAPSSAFSSLAIVEGHRRARHTRQTAAVGRFFMPRRVLVVGKVRHCHGRCDAPPMVRPVGWLPPPWSGRLQDGGATMVGRRI